MISTAATSGQRTQLCDRGSLRKWKDTMGTSNTRSRKIRSTIGKIVMALVCASMIGGTFIAPAYADEHGRRRGYQKHSRRAYYPPPRRHYYYSEPVYAPPPVYYHPAPYQSPGISIVFPFH